MFEEFNPLEGKQLQIMDENGKILNEELMPKISDEDIKKLYYTMRLVRTADTKALKLQRSGRMGTFAQVYGQEAQIGSVYPLEKDDWFVPAFRETASMVYRGMPLWQFYLFYMGSEEGHRFDESMQRTLPIAITVGGHLPHATGIAWASKIKGEKNVTLTSFGDGATSEGDFHEGLNFAGVFQTPTIFYCQNNQWAISLPRARQTHAKTIAQKAIAYGIPGMQIDGNDIFAVIAASQEAIKRAREGKGPSLIEAVTYRLGPHTTSDDPTIYRDEAEVEEWKKKDPITRLQKYMEEKGLWTEEWEKEITEKIEREVDENVKKAEEFKMPGVEDIFDYHFEELTENLKEQLEYAKEIEKENPLKKE